jgi:hypothetical protein
MDVTAIGDTGMMTMMPKCNSRFAGSPSVNHTFNIGDYISKTSDWLCFYSKDHLLASKRLYNIDETNSCWD